MVRGVRWSEGDDDEDGAYRLASNWIAGGVEDEDDDDSTFPPEDRYKVDPNGDCDDGE